MWHQPIDVCDSTKWLEAMANLGHLWQQHTRIMTMMRPFFEHDKPVLYIMTILRWRNDAISWYNRFMHDENDAEVMMIMETFLY